MARETRWWTHPATAARDKSLDIARITRTSRAPTAHWSRSRAQSLKKLLSHVLARHGACARDVRGVFAREFAFGIDGARD